MESRADRAEALFKQGYNCAQAVVLAFSDLTGLDEDQAAVLSMPFGAGLSRLREVCGAVSGMSMVLGLLYAPKDPNDHAAKAAHYALTQQAALAFQEKNGAYICRTLLSLGTEGKDDPTPEKRTESYYKKRPCSEYVRDCAQIVQDIINQRES